MKATIIAVIVYDGKMTIDAVTSERCGRTECFQQNGTIHSILAIFIVEREVDFTHTHAMTI